ncbi:hypothetical protein F4782DRAFT_526640 [Xylaria castorea]|nr:hypothetical protein F4782DRAFT_526640 [Xylaria castorea]
MIHDNGLHTPIIHDRADHPDVDIANENKDPGPESGNNPDLLQIDVDYSSKSISDGGENVYFSTSHHEIVNPAMFKSARATLDRLQPYLEPIMGRLGRKFVKASSNSHMSLIAVELRMAGEMEEGSKKITLQPSVWIPCGLAGRDFNHGTPFCTGTPNDRLQRKVHVHIEQSECQLVMECYVALQLYMAMMLKYYTKTYIASEVISLSIYRLGLNLPQQLLAMVFLSTGSNETWAMKLGVLRQKRQKPW